MICADSIHSQYKVLSKYPQVSQTNLQRLYGSSIPAMDRLMWTFRSTLPEIFGLVRSKAEKSYDEVNQINLTEFYSTTTSVFYMFSCYMRRINCRHSWQMKSTIMGTCLTLNTQNLFETELRAELKRRHQRTPQMKDPIMAVMEEKLPTANKYKSINFIVGYNKSDSTFGWNGFNNALSLFYSLGEFEKRHSITLVPGLNPKIEFMRSETILLGAPYSACNHSVNYTQHRCRVENFFATVVDQCNCYPRFDQRWAFLRRRFVQMEHLY